MAILQSDGEMKTLNTSNRTGPQDFQKTCYISMGQRSATSSRPDLSIQATTDRNTAPDRTSNRKPPSHLPDTES
ncbi:hypothetical protein NPIL_81471 [Nephila pilipes]|uniref:Uncharacterized protein n=1 Tax=Nephila pilipes TaxID=299642 RepID=A0A8X6N3K6_NEPPI|nr:hypothetical protein NPIL_81471 [Nephila pilipes]